MYGSGFGFGSSKSALVARLEEFKEKNKRLSDQALIISKFHEEFDAEIKNSQHKTQLMLAMMDCYFPASAALDFFRRYGRLQGSDDIQAFGETQRLIPRSRAGQDPSYGLDQSQHEFDKTLSDDWLRGNKNDLKNAKPWRALTSDFGFLILSLLACSGGSYNKEARIMFGFDSLPIQQMTADEQPLGYALGFSGALWLLFLFWIAEGKLWTGASSKGCNYLITGVIVILGAFAALPSGVVSNTGFEVNYADLFGMPPPKWMLEYDIAMLANTGMNARLAVANLHNMMIGGEIIVRSIASTQGWFRVQLIIQLIMTLFLSVLCSIVFVESGTQAPVVKEFDNATKRYITSVIQNIPQFMLLMMTLMFNSPYSAWKHHKKDTLVHCCMIFMILGGLMDGVLAKLTFDGYGVTEGVSLGLSWMVTIFASGGFMPMGATLARKFRETYANARAVCCCCGCCVYCQGSENSRTTAKLEA